MNAVFSPYEAKARFSEVMRLVREGGTVTVTYRGDPVAEIRPFERGAMSVEEHFAELEKRGILVPAKHPSLPIRVGAARPGALERFFAERGE